MKPSLKSIRKYLYPELNNPTEVCVYYHDDDDSWHNGTEISTPNLCTHKFGYHDIMGHTHPKRISGHPVEVNYYPSYHDIVYPIYNSKTQKNYILTPIGLFVSNYDLTGYNFKIEQQAENHYAGYINHLFFPIHTLLHNMVNDLSLYAISKQVTPNLITHIDDICNAVTTYVNTHILEQFPKEYELTYIDIHQIENLSGGRRTRRKIKTRRIKTRRIKTRKSTRKSTRKN